MSAIRPPVAAANIAWAKGSALSGATTGIKLTYTCPANRLARVLSAWWFNTAGTSATIRYQVTSAAVSYALQGRATSDVLSQPLWLAAGDTFEVNVITLGAGAVFDAIIFAEEYEIN